MDFNFTLTPWQKEFLFSKKKILALSGASNSGKSWIARLKPIIHCMSIPGYNCFITAVTHRQTERAVIEPMLQFFYENEIQHIAQFKKGEGRLQFYNGSYIEVFSADNMNYALRSREFSCGFFEELSTIPEKNVKELISEALRRLRYPAKPPYHLLAATNPGLKTAWIYENIFAPEVVNPDLQKWHIDYDHGYNKKDLEYRQTLLSQDKRQQDIFFRGKWGVLEGQAFPINPELMNPDPPDLNNKWHISFDYGYAPDPMVYLLIENRGSTIVIRDIIELVEKPISEHHKYLDNWFEKYPIKAFTGDTSPGSAEIRNMLIKKYKCIYMATRKDRTRGWANLGDHLHNKLIWFECPKCDRVIEAIESLIWMTNKVDVESGDDHAPDAIRYYCESGLYLIGRMNKHGKAS